MTEKYTQMSSNLKIFDLFFHYFNGKNGKYLYNLPEKINENMHPYCKINGRYVWNYEWLQNYFLQNFLPEPIYYFENNDNTISCLKVVSTSSHFLPFSKNEAERLLLKCAIAPPKTNYNLYTLDDEYRCRHCMNFKRIPKCDFLDNEVWHTGDDSKSYFNGDLLSICDDCLKLPQKYMIEDIKPVYGLHAAKLVTSKNTDIKYLFASKNYQTFFYEKTLRVDELYASQFVLNTRYKILCCKLCGVDDCGCHLHIQKYYCKLIEVFWLIKQMDLGYGVNDVKFYIQRINM